jgi:hypothetical protein
MKRAMITNKFKGCFLATIMCLAWNALADAQNVTISPTSGKLIAALTGESNGATEVGFIDGYASMWRHNQLPLTMTVADEPDLTESGLLSNHACDIKVYNNKIIDCSTGSCYLVLSLPKGYRFTGYKFVIKNNLGNDITTFFSSNSQDQDWYFNEMDKSYSSIKNTVTIPQTSHGTSSTSSFTLQRTSTGKGDMSNLLYLVFRGNKTSSSGIGAFGAISFESIEINFAADDAFDETIAPSTESSTGVSHVELPFNTSKTDIGTVSWQTKDYQEKNNWGRVVKTYTNSQFSYIYSNVKDISANNTLFEATCVDASVGTIGSTTGNSGITALSYGGNLYYGLKSNIYYVESPTTVTDQNGNVLPVGYRITGAKVNYAFDNTTKTITSSTSDGFYIIYNTNYYLDANTLKFVKSPSSPTLWQKDASNHIYNDNTYLAYNSSNKLIRGSNTTANVITDGENIYYVKTGLLWDTYYYLIGNTKENQPSFSNTNSNRASISNHYPTTTIESKPYTLTIYDKDGSTIIGGNPITVDANNPSGTVTLTGLNNDAIKFKIDNTNEERPALVTIDLTLEPLNPYVQSMKVTATSSEYGEKISQQFLSDDFRFGGDPFTFYAPANDKNPTYTFTFENLKSNYADETYTGAVKAENPGNSRYNFVKSAYYNTVNEDLYANASIVADHTYTDKVNVDVAGATYFKFNNADELVNDGTHQDGDENYLLEYLFSTSAYGNNFKKIELKNGEQSKIFYLFVEDETRYNIAPTWKTQHRYYAYYDMNIELETKNYTPEITWVPLYNHTLTYDGTNDVDNYMAGAKIKTTETGTGAKYGYLTATQIKEKIEADIKANVLNAPKNMKYVLYADASDLYSVVYNAGTSTSDDGLELFKSSLGDNALIYLPTNNTYDGVNFAYKTVSGAFNSCGNIVLTDKQAFFAPYDIQVGSAYYATYKRLFTTDANGKVNYATILLPFTMTLSTDGVHQNPSKDCSFTVSEMVKDNCLEAEATDIGGTGNVGKDFQGTAHFTKLTGGTTEANKPYHVEILSYTAAENDKSSYIATQYGSNIIATPSNTNVDDNEVIDGETATGTINALGTYSFTNKGTYAGQTLAQSLNIFYFGKNHYLSNKNINTSTGNLYVYPFRSYYEYTGPNNVAKLSVMEIAFGENTPTGIETTETAKQDADFAVVTSRGTITAVARNDAHLSIHNLSGQSVANTAIQAGETLTFNVPAGVYIINGKKVSVK